MKPKIKIAFVDDHPVLLAGVAAIFAEDDQFHVVAQGRSADDAVLIAAEHQPDVCVVDLNMPGDVYASISEIKRISPKTKFVAFTAAIETDIAVKTLRSGVHGYVVKGSSSDELRAGVAAVLEGDTFVTNGLASRVLSAMAKIEHVGAMRLSVRETQIVRLLYQGKTNREIASRLDISEKTVKHYMTILMQKLNTRNRVELAMAAQSIVPHLTRNSPLGSQSLAS